MLSFGDLRVGGIYGLVFFKKFQSKWRLLEGFQAKHVSNSQNFYEFLKEFYI